MSILFLYYISIISYMKNGPIVAGPEKPRPTYCQGNLLNLNCPL